MDEKLLLAIKAHLDEIDALIAELAGLEEAGVYRYYHQSFKVYSLQAAIEQALQLLERIAPVGTQLNHWFLPICGEALQHKFRLLDRTWDWDRMNQNWHAGTRPILEAFWHCSYFLRMLARFGRELDEPPTPASGKNFAGLSVRPTPAGWLAVLNLYGVG